MAEREKQTEIGKSISKVIISNLRCIKDNNKVLSLLSILVNKAISTPLPQFSIPLIDIILFSW